MHFRQCNKSRISHAHLRRKLKVAYLITTQANAERSLVRNYFERVETRRHPSKSSNRYDEGIVQGVRKLTQTGILWSQVQVLVGPPRITIPTLGLVFF